MTTSLNLREAACLAHTVGGVVLRLTCHSGHAMLVSYACLGADLDPCGLRVAVLTGKLTTLSVADVELVAGLRPLGGGLYQRTHPDLHGNQDRAGTEERWLVTTLGVDDVVAVLDEVGADSDPDALHAVVRPDPGLGLCAVCLAGPATEIDQVAVAVIGRLLADELIAGIPASQP